MFELALEQLIQRTLFSLTKVECQIFNTIISECHPSCFNDAFDTSVQFITKAFFIPSGNDSEQQNIQNILMRCKPTVALYCSYYAMDYITRNEAPQGTPFDSDFIKSVYSTDNQYSVKNIYNKYRRQIKQISEIVSHPDPAYTNPGYMIKWSEEHPGEPEPHIFLGRILLYLKRAISQESDSQKKLTLYLHGLTPAVTLASIRVCNYLPNGTFVNRPSTIQSQKNSPQSQKTITGNTISKIDYEVSVNKGGISYTNNEQSYSFPTPRINYPVSNTLSDLINLAVFDDVYRMERLNTALTHYSSYFSGDVANTSPVSNMSKSIENALAGACSLYLSLPLSISTLLDDDMNRLANAIVTNNTEDEITAEKEILSIANIYFPYLVGIICSILFVEHQAPLSQTDFDISTLQSMTWEESEHIFEPMENALTKLRTESEIKTTISELEQFLFSWTLKLKTSLLSRSDRVWYRDDLKNYNTKISEATSRSRGKQKSNTQIRWSNANHQFSFDKTLGIMLNQTSNIARTRSLLDENYWTYGNQKTYVRLLSQNLNTKNFTDNINLKKHTSDSYLEALVNGFHQDIWIIS